MLSREIFEFFRSSHRRCFMKKVALKNFSIFTGKFQDCNFIKNRLQRRCFPLNISKFLRSCDTDTYFRSIIFSNISEILFMCITDYFILLSCSCAFKTLNLKFLTESKVKRYVFTHLFTHHTRSRKI